MIKNLLNLRNCIDVLTLRLFLKISGNKYGIMLSIFEI